MFLLAYRPGVAMVGGMSNIEARRNAQAAKDLAHLLRLLGVDSYEEATVVIAMSGALLRKVAECDDAIPGNEVVTEVRAFLAAGEG